MSPFRVLVRNNSMKCWDVLASMLSTDKVTGMRNVYIVKKKYDDETMRALRISEDLAAHMLKRTAHSQMGRQNSEILDRYIIIKNVLNTRKYAVQRVVGLDASGIKLSSPVSDREYTQGDCLRAAMVHFCESNDLTIIREL